MSVNYCEKLDAYVADDLHGDDAARFEVHVATCRACREAVEQQRWIDALLRSPAVAEVESPPDAILEPFRTALAQRRRRRTLRYACGLAAASVLLALGWFELNRQASRPAAPKPHSVASVEPEATPAPEPPRATFVSHGDTIAVPLESPASDVTVVQLYPTTDTERRWRFELALQATYPAPNGG